MSANLQSGQPTPHESYISVQNAELYYREIGQGRPIFILHGGPDFDHTYLLPDMDRLSGDFRLIYYDQRGRGRSSGNVQPEDVSIQSEIEDLEALRDYFRLASVAVLGHSWGGVLAMEYAIRHPDRVSHLILMNTAPASHDDYALFRQEFVKKLGDDAEKRQALSSSAAYAEGDPDTVAAYYRIQYGATVKRSGDLEKVIASLRSSFTKESILKSWAIEDRLMDETWGLSEYDLLPELRRLSIPTLVIHGDYDFVPVECSVHIAQSIQGARLVVLEDTGHFSYLESPNAVREAIVDFFHSS
jgi:proline iminopeptidase